MQTRSSHNVESVRHNPDRPDLVPPDDTTWSREPENHSAPLCSPDVAKILTDEMREVNRLEQERLARTGPVANAD